MKVADKNLFPLNNINSRFSGYLMDADDNIYTTKNKFQTPTTMTGSRTSSGHYFTLNKNTYRRDFLVNAARNHRLFKSETAAPQVAVVSEVVKSNDKRSYAKDLDEGIKLRGVMIAAVENGKLVFSSEPKIHTTEQSYRSEMERLANTKPGMKFVSVKITGSVVAGGVKWE